MGERKRILIVGGVAGGASMAARARRLSEEAEIVLFERGEYVSFANCGLPYHIGGVIPERKQLLVQTAEGLRKRFRIDVRIQTEVLNIDRERKTVTVRDRIQGTEQTEAYDVLVLSPGAEPLRPAFPGLDLPQVFTLRSMDDMDRIKAHIGNAELKHAVVVGGGFIGLEMAEALIQLGWGVDVVEMAPQVMTSLDPEMAVLVQQALTAHGVTLFLGRTLTSIKPRGAHTVEAYLDNGEVRHAGLVIMAAGVRPESQLARGCGLDLGERGGILVNSHQQTSDPAIYAVGDAVECLDAVAGVRTFIPLAGPANRQGRIAADHIFGRPSAYRGTQGTAVCKVFERTAASTGLNERTLKRLKLAYEKIYLHPAQHAGYYPGATTIHMKVLFHPESGKLLGAQAVGNEGVDKRMDVLALALRAGMTVLDLEHVELCYAPPYGSAKDPVNMAGFMASNVLRGDVRLCHVSDLQARDEKTYLVDVRTPGEFARGTIPGAVNIPIDELRERLNEVPRERELLVFCQVGLRGYLACRILQAHGISCRNLSGGFTTYKLFVG